MATPITSVSGIGAQTAEILVENGFADAEALAAAKEEELLKISGFGPSRAKKFIAAAQALVGDVDIEPADTESSTEAFEVAEPVKAEESAEVAESEEKEEKVSGPKVCTQKLCKKKKKKAKPAKSGKKKKKSSRKKKSK